PKRPEALARADVRTTDARADGRTTDVARSAEPRRTTAREEPPIVLVLDESATNSATGPAVSTAGLTNAIATTTLEPRAASKGSSTSVDTDVVRSKDVAADAPLEVRWIARRGQRILRFPRPVTFAENVDTLDASAKRMLEQAALAILRDPALRHMKLEVVGHAEARERGKPELSERRARAARAFLVDRGAPLARLALVAAADRDPLSAGARPADRAQNRRVELRIALED
ncbi:OmpA family protein, partial [Myxococcota bacterium]|nr:OmpA family protein [Myxococcota bacterium]